MILIYTDGNGNVYKILGHRLSYQPVVPSQSSSGVYSGGSAYSKDLNPIEYGRLKILAEKALLEVEDSVELRVKGTGSLVWEAEGRERSVILSPYSQAKEELEKFLLRLGK